MDLCNSPPQDKKVQGAHNKYPKKQSVNIGIFRGTFLKMEHFKKY